MGFPQHIVEDLLVKAARHCCVCREHKGIKLEVHHIVPRSRGGTDDPDNGIPLCFDCHAEVETYNDQHPRGRKFHPSELRKHRDEWFRIVESRATSGEGTPSGEDPEQRDLARRILRAVFGIRNGVVYVRSPAILEGEPMATGADSYTDRLRAEKTRYEQRWGTVAEPLADLQRTLPDVEVFWGSEAVKALDDLLALLRKLALNLRYHAKWAASEDGGRAWGDAWIESGRITISSGTRDEPDDFEAKLNEAIVRIEFFVLPHV